MGRKLRYYGKNYGSIPKTIELRFTNKRNKEITKNYETLIYNEKMDYWSFWTNTYFRTLIIYDKILGNMKKKLWYYWKNYGTITKIIELWFTMEKYYGTMEKRKVAIVYYSIFLLRKDQEPHAISCAQVHIQFYYGWLCCSQVPHPYFLCPVNYIPAAMCVLKCKSIYVGWWGKGYVKGKTEISQLSTSLLLPQWSMMLWRTTLDTKN